MGELDNHNPKNVGCKRKSGENVSFIFNTYKTNKMKNNQREINCIVFHCFILFFNVFWARQKKCRKNINTKFLFCLFFI